MRKILMAPLALGAAVALAGPVFAQSTYGQSERGQSMQGQSEQGQSSMQGQSAQGQSGMQSENGEASAGKTVSLAKVPGPAKTAAKQALGATPTSARIVPDTHPQQYELQAMNTQGEQKTVQVTGTGKIMKQNGEESGSQGQSEQGSAGQRP